MANSEDIEAKLCAYIEGDLDPAAQADIERHLQVHPQHGRLIQELMRTRDLVRALPRAAAPGDLSETLQGQIERSILLGTEEDAARMRISRWPQIGALAAVLLLAVGLGLVVFFVLRGSFNHPQMTPVVAQGTSQPSDTTDNPLADVVGSHVPESDVKEKPGSMKSGALPADEARADKSDIPLAKFDARALRSRLDNAGVLMKDVGSPGAAPVVLVVSATDPAVANGAVKGYLASNNIEYEPVPAGALERDASLAAPRNVVNAGGSESNIAGQAASPNGRDAEVNNNLRNYNSSNAVSSDNASRLNNAPPDAAEHLQQLALAKTQANGGGAGNLYVVRNLSRQQAADLGISLARQEPGVKCQVVAGVGGQAMKAMVEPAPTTEPVDDEKMGQVAVARGMAMPAKPGAEPQPAHAADTTFRAGDLVNVYLNNELSQRGIEPVQSAIVAADGAIHLRDIGDIAAAGQAPADVEQEIARAYAAKLGNAPKVSVRKIEPSFGGVAGEGAAAPPAPAEAAAPAGPAEKVDVVIVIDGTDAANQTPTLPPAASGVSDDATRPSN